MLGSSTPRAVIVGTLAFSLGLIGCRELFGPDQMAVPSGTFGLARIGEVALPLTVAETPSVRQLLLADTVILDAHGVGTRTRTFRVDSVQSEGSSAPWTMTSELRIRQRDGRLRSSELVVCFASRVAEESCSALGDQSVRVSGTRMFIGPREYARLGAAP